MIERLKVCFQGLKYEARCDADVLGGASNPLLAHKFTYVRPWRGHASRPSVPHAQRSGAVLFGWVATADGDIHQHW